MLGVGFGSIFFPRTVTQTSTQITTIIKTSVTTSTITTNSSITLVTATVMTVLVEQVVATCTTISGTRSIVFREVPAEITSVTTVYPETWPSPSHLPSEYLVTQVTASTGTASTGYNVASQTC